MANLVNIPVVDKGPVPPPVCINDQVRGRAMLLSSPTSDIPMCFLARHMLKKAGVRAGYYLEAAPKFVCLVEGTAIALTADHAFTKIVRTDMVAPCTLMVEPGEALSFIPTSDGEIVEYVPYPHASVMAETKKVDFGEHLQAILKTL